MMNRKIIPLVFLMAVIPCAVSIPLLAETVSDELNYQFLVCGTFNIQVVSQFEDDDTAFLKHQFRDKIGNRLRQAVQRDNLFYEGPQYPARLVALISVHRSSGFQAVSLVFQRTLYEPMSNQLKMITTWEAEKKRMTGADERELMKDLSDLLDQFISRFAVVNTAQACKESSVMPRHARTIQVLRLAGYGDEYWSEDP